MNNSNDNTVYHQPDVLLEGGLLSLNPLIGSFPHVLIKAGPKTLDMVAETVRCELGLWGENPLFRADGSHYLEPPSGKITNDFILWKLPANQRHLQTRAMVGQDPEFKMFISADTPLGALERTYEHLIESESRWFGDYIVWICGWIAELRWALIPLAGDIGWSIFVTAHDASDLVARSIPIFKEIPTAHLVEGRGRFHWVFTEPGAMI